MFAQGGEVSPVAWLAGGNMEDQAGNERLGFLGSFAGGGGILR